MNAPLVRISVFAAVLMLTTATRGADAQGEVRDEPWRKPEARRSTSSSSSHQASPRHRSNAKSLRARGSFSVDIKRNDGQVTKFRTDPPKPRQVQVRTKDDVKTLILEMQ